MPVAVGIDFGSTHCNVGVWHHGRPEIIANHHGLRATPSLVAFADTEVHVGEAASAQMAKNASNTIFGFKWLVGKGHSEDDPRVKDLIESAPFRVTLDDAGQASFSVTHKGSERSVTAETLCSHLFSHLKSIAEHFSGEDIAQCVLCVPPSFTEEQIESLCAVGRAAGLPLSLVLLDPVATAIAYGFDRPDAAAAGSSREDGAAADSGSATAASDDNASTASAPAPAPKRRIVVIDWGGGGVTATVLSRHDGILALQATRVDPLPGGHRFVRRLMEFCAKDFKRRHGADPLESARSTGKLQRACEETVKALSSSAQADMYVEALCEGIDCRVRVSRGRFEDMCSDLFAAVRKPVEAALAAAGASADAVDAVLLAGGVCHVPRAQQAVRDCFPAGTNFGKGLFADEAVAIGATIQANLLQEHPSLVAGAAKGASGATAAAATLSRSLLCCPVTLAIDTLPPGEDGPTVVIPAGAVLPCQERTTLRVYVAPGEADPADELTLQVLEFGATGKGDKDGEGAMNGDAKAGGARLLGVLVLPGVASGEVEVAVGFTLRSEGVLKVEALETASRSSAQLVINAS